LTFRLSNGVLMTTSTWLLHHRCRWLTCSDAGEGGKVYSEDSRPSFKPFCSSQHLIFAGQSILGSP
jgi:hypothetical protein